MDNEYRAAGYEPPEAITEEEIQALQQEAEQAEVNLIVIGILQQEGEEAAAMDSKCHGPVFLR
jgi:hypothetical protein